MYDNGYNAPINVKLYPTQYEDGWGITKGFDPKFHPKGGAFDSKGPPLSKIFNDIWLNF